jgi:3D (Asp-Asp-Asp) domain-containing protein
MKLFFGGSAAFAATLLSASVLFYAKPLFAESSASPKPTSTQQEKKDTTETAPAEATPAQDAATAGPETQQALGAADTRAPESVPAAPPGESEKPALSVSSGTPAAGNRAPAAALAPVAAEPITESQAYVATAYSLPGRTASGMRVAKGIIAADPRVLPLGSRVRLEAGPYSGDYIVADTGSAVKGRKIDVWVPSYREACRFGRRNIKLSVLSYGKRRTPATQTRTRRRS